MKPDAKKRNQDIVAIRKWMSKEEYLPDTIGMNDMYLINLFRNIIFVTYFINSVQ